MKRPSSRLELCCLSIQRVIKIIDLKGSLIHIPFQLLAIADSLVTAKHILSMGYEFPEIGFGLMLRNAEHRSDQVKGLTKKLMIVDTPSNVTLITNGCSVEGVVWRHLTSLELQTCELPSGHFGCSVHTVDEAIYAQEVGATYITYSPVFATPSKPNATPTGLAQLQECVNSVSIPVIALGGIDSFEKSKACLRGGASGIAGIRLALPENRTLLTEMIADIAKK